MKKRTDYRFYVIVALLFIAIALVNTGCTGQKNGCYSTKGMSGYK